MSTRSALAFKTEKGWQGIYCHWDGYPTNRGPQLWEILMKQFILNKGKIGISNDGATALQSFVDIYIKGHRSGWSSFPNECYCHTPEFVMRDGVNKNEPFMTEKKADPLSIEWVYVIDVKNKRLLIYTHGRAEGQHEEKVEVKETKEVRKWKTNNYKHYLVTELNINPDVKEPDWKQIEDMGNEISNNMQTLYGKEI